MELFLEMWDNPITNKLVATGYTVMAISFAIVILVYIVGTIQEKLKKKRNKD